jgi:hypothetical protein
MADKPKVYVETTVISYLTARPSNELVAAAHQEITKEWWAIKRERFELFVSELVLQEAGAGDQEASQRRLGILASIPLLKPDQQTRRLASLLASSTNIPQRALQTWLMLPWP